MQSNTAPPIWPATPWKDGRHRHRASCLSSAAVAPLRVHDAVGVAPRSPMSLTSMMSSNRGGVHLPVLGQGNTPGRQRQVHQGPPREDDGIGDLDANMVASTLVLLSCQPWPSVRRAALHRHAVSREEKQQTASFSVQRRAAWASCPAICVLDPFSLVCRLSVHTHTRGGKGTTPGSPGQELGGVVLEDGETPNVRHGVAGETIDAPGEIRHDGICGLRRSPRCGSTTEAGRTWGRAPMPRP